MSWLVWTIIGAAVYLTVGAGVARLRYYLIDNGHPWKMTQIIEILGIEGTVEGDPPDWKRHHARDFNAAYAVLWPFTLAWETSCLLFVVIWVVFLLVAFICEFLSRPLRNLIRYIWRHVFMVEDQR